MRPAKLALLACAWLACLGVLGTTCQPRPSSAALIRANDTFMLTYIDSNERLRVRSSSDGYRWQDGTLSAAGIFDNGVGSASTDDPIGTIRMLAYPNVGGRLTIRAGLGTVFDSTDRTFNDVSTHGAPAIAYASTNHWLITTLGGSLNQAAVVHDYDALTKTLAPVALSGVTGLANNRLVRPPQLAARDRRVVLGWMRWTPQGQNVSPGPVQLVVGNAQSGGGVQWTNVVNFTTAEAGFTGPLTDPALAHDGARFLLGAVRGRGADRHVFIYQSPDGLTWQPYDDVAIAASEVYTVRVAAHDGGNMLVGVTRPGGAEFWRKARGEWESLRGAVTGPRRESHWAMSLLAPGRRRDPIYVDRANTAGPWNGTLSQPYRYVQSAFDRAKRGDTVLVQGGFYPENVTMAPGTILERRGNDVLIRSPSTAPTIRAQGDNVIENVIVECTEACIHVELDRALEGLEGTDATGFTNIVRTRTRNGSIGVLLTGSDAFNFGSNNRRLFRMRILRSWLANHFGAGFLGPLSGPSQGSLQVALDVRDNVFQGNYSGIQLEMAGRARNTGGFTRAHYTGRVQNNLVFGGVNGVSLDARNAGVITSAFNFNTIARAFDHGIVANAEPGPNGDSRVQVQLYCNILAGNGQSGYTEFSGRAAPSILQKNVFSANRTHYYDYPTDAFLNTAAALNSATTGGSGNIVADPLFVRDGFRWTSGSIHYDDTGHFFLQQDAAATSQAVNLCGSGTVEQHLLANHTTRTDYERDANLPDAGWHYPRPE